MSKRDKMFYYVKPQLRDLILGYAERNNMNKSEVCNHFAKEFFARMTGAEKSQLLASSRQQQAGDC
ncbi:MAG: hypothetical protein EOP56_08195 [Sphingobacteriales bacterium]|nr:MAG: hypothetical protein EOP56_08195 [Sphingobacteriales bacterium]